MSPIVNSNIQTNTTPKKRGRKSKKEIEFESATLLPLDYEEYPGYNLDNSPKIV